MTILTFSKVLKVFFHDRYSAIGDLTASNENERLLNVFKYREI